MCADKHNYGLSPLSTNITTKLNGWEGGALAFSCFHGCNSDNIQGW